MDLASTKIVPSCPGCGSNGLVFQPSEGSLQCSFCKHRTAPIGGVPAGDSSEMDLAQGITIFEDSLQTQSVHSVQCSGCGSQLVQDQGASTFACPYCGTNLASQSALKTVTTHPSYILPFSISREKALGSLGAWQRSLWFAPQNFKRKAVDNSQISGVYLPYWTFDANVVCDYTGQRGREKPKRQKNQQTEYEWRSCAGNVTNWFDDVLIPASEEIPVHLQSGIENWNTADLLTWDARFQAGFRESLTTVQISRAHNHAREFMSHQLDQLIKADIGGDAQRITSISPLWSKECFRLMLVPIWVYHGTHKNKNLLVLVNGRNASVTGERPYSTLKILSAIAFMLVLLIWFIKNNS